MYLSTYDMFVSLNSVRKALDITYAAKQLSDISSEVEGGTILLSVNLDS